MWGIAPVVELWLFDFVEWFEYEAQLNDVLAASEVKRAEQFHFAADRSRCRLSRAITRLVLAHRLGTHPRRLVFTQEGNGKPRLDGYTLCFNISHTTRQLLVGVADSSLGVDTEQDDGRLDVDLVAHAVLHPDEMQQFQALPAVHRRPWLLRLWTERESFLKAIGAGLSVPLKDYVWRPTGGLTKQVMTLNGEPTGWHTHYIGWLQHHAVTVATTSPHPEWLVRQGGGQAARTALLKLLYRNFHGQG